MNSFEKLQYLQLPRGSYYDIEINKADLILMCKKYNITSLDSESIRNGILEAKL